MHHCLIVKHIIVLQSLSKLSCIMSMSQSMKHAPAAPAATAPSKAQLVKSSEKNRVVGAFITATTLLPHRLQYTGQKQVHRLREMSVELCQNAHILLSLRISRFTAASMPIFRSLLYYPSIGVSNVNYRQPSLVGSPSSPYHWTTQFTPQCSRECRLAHLPCITYFLHGHG